MYCALFNLKYIQSTEGGVVPSWVCIKILPKRVLLHEPACSKENELNSIKMSSNHCSSNKLYSFCRPSDV